MIGLGLSFRFFPVRWAFSISAVAASKPREVLQSVIIVIHSSPSSSLTPSARILKSLEYRSRCSNLFLSSSLFLRRASTSSALVLKRFS